ncbi:MAG: Beta-hexosaminidase, GH3 family [Candidatus Ozemobacter sibiricus]|uniref:Beta-hexosaminidase, GH3 family n=1 Tax=Candidatus Ozemobacter sibiricus TaxID=2268124 RepID=A0A367ZTR2_9BACT|nr:MAG: Beta-hexosaminidase, GH3 family [Candidatus Ozemobacter sibiricus]
MDLKKQIGQLFVVGYQGLEPTPEFLEFVHEWGIGGIIVFVRNIGDPQRLPAVLRTLAEAAGQVQFTSIDQEGGLVMRILSGGSLFPGAMALAATGRPELAEQVGAAMGRELRALGINWNLAPVLDINHAQNPGIGARSFGETPEQVARFGVPFIRGLQQGGVLACAKHFPGLGHARADTHLRLPTIPYDRERLQTFELVPFRAAIEAGVGAIMTSHVFFPAFETTPNLPATLSRAVLTDLLRHDMGFEGLVITDDLEMGAITETYGVPEAARLAFLAGADLLLICHDLGRERQAAETLLAEVQANPEARRRLDASLARIERARRHLAAPIGTATLAELAARHRPLIEKTHRQAVLVSHQRPGVLPVSVGRPCLAFCPQIASLVQVEETHQGDGLLALIKERLPGAQGASFDPRGTADEIVAEFEALAAPAPADAPLLLFTYNAHLFDGQAKAIRRILARRPQAIVVAVRNPYDLGLFPEAGAGLATFGFRTPALRACLDVLTGAAAPGQGPWPVDLALASHTSPATT